MNRPKIPEVLKKSPLDINYKKLTIFILIFFTSLSFLIHVGRSTFLADEYSFLYHLKIFLPFILIFIVFNIPNHWFSTQSKSKSSILFGKTILSFILMLYGNLIYTKFFLHTFHFLSPKKDATEIVNIDKIIEHNRKIGGYIKLHGYNDINNDISGCLEYVTLTFGVLKGTKQKIQSNDTLTLIGKKSKFGFEINYIKFKNKTLDTKICN